MTNFNSTGLHVVGLSSAHHYFYQYRRRTEINHFILSLFLLPPRLSKLRSTGESRKTLSLSLWKIFNLSSRQFGWSIKMSKMERWVDRWYIWWLSNLQSGKVARWTADHKYIWSRYICTTYGWIHWSGNYTCLSGGLTYLISWRQLQKWMHVSYITHKNIFTPLWQIHLINLYLSAGMQCLWGPLMCGGIKQILSEGKITGLGNRRRGDSKHLEVMNSLNMNHPEMYDESLPLRTQDKGQKTQKWHSVVLWCF